MTKRRIVIVGNPSAAEIAETVARLNARVTVCLHQTNPAGGFEAMHNHLCGYAGCEENVEVHVAVPGSTTLIFCANVCNACAKKLKNKHDGVVISEVKYAL